MKYEAWRHELFGHPPDADPVVLNHSDDFQSVPACEAFDFVDRMLIDPEVHNLFNKEQIGIGIQTVYSNCCSNLPFLYTEGCDEQRRVIGIQNLIHLYRNYFERYCTAPVVRRRYSDYQNSAEDGRIGFMCSNFWDTFVLTPFEVSPSMISAGINVMRTALDSRNDKCLASAIDGLGDWGMMVCEASTVLEQWLRNPTTNNPVILEHAQALKRGRFR